jgi:nucleotide-binding universal stress UspA family protein
MKPLVRILAATDLSAPAHHAVDRGFRIAAEVGAGYSVMHAFELDAVDSLVGLLGEGLAAVKQRLEDDARKALRQMLEDPVHNRAVAANAMVVAGSPLESIADRADAIDADLLVLGARGESFLRHALLGSTASRLLRKSIRRPVLVVKQPPRGPYRRLLIPVDFSRSSEGAIRLGYRVAPQADIVLLHAFELPFEGKLAFAGVDENVIREYIRVGREECRRRLHDLARAAGLEPVQYSAIVRHGDPSQQIIAEEQEGDCDLIVMGKHGAHLTEELLLGSVTKHVLYESQCDVMVFSGGNGVP